MNSENCGEMNFQPTEIPRERITNNIRLFEISQRRCNICVLCRQNWKEGDLFGSKMLKQSKHTLDLFTKTNNKVKCNWSGTPIEPMYCVFTTAASKVQPIISVIRYLCCVVRKHLLAHSLILTAELVHFKIWYFAYKFISLLIIFLLISYPLFF